MVRKRKPKTETKTEAAFIGAVDKGFNPRAPRKYKSVTVPMNEYEYDRLTRAVESSGLRTMEFVRECIEEGIKKRLD